MRSAFPADHDSKRLAIGPPNHLSRLGADRHPVDNFAFIIRLAEHVELRHGHTPNGVLGSNTKLATLHRQSNRITITKLFPKASERPLEPFQMSFTHRPSWRLAGILLEIPSSLMLSNPIEGVPVGWSFVLVPPVLLQVYLSIFARQEKSVYLETWQSSKSCLVLWCVVVLACQKPFGVKSWP